jgi:hypothetical protein
LELGWESRQRSSPYEGDSALLERFAKGLKDIGTELSRLVEEENAFMGKANLARAEPAPPADHAFEGGGVVWGAKRRTPSEDRARAEGAR